MSLALILTLTKLLLQRLQATVLTTTTAKIQLIEERVTNFSEP